MSEYKDENIEEAVNATRIDAVIDDVAQNTKDIADIKTTVDRMIGGRQAVTWGLTFVVGVLMVIVTLLAYHK